MSRPDAPLLRLHVDRCLARLPEGYTHRTSFSLLRAVCDDATWGILKNDELDTVTAALIERLQNPDLSYLAYKAETGDESRNWLRYRLWITQKRAALVGAS